MRQIKRIPVTREGFEKLKEDLKELKNKRPSAVETLSDARRLGDLSENGLYTAAKMRLRGIDAQIFRLEMQIKLADIKEGNYDVVEIGSRVTIQDENEVRDFQIVGDYEANPSENKISTHSPIGKALFGKKVGDEAIISTPNGEKSIKVLEITK